MTTSRNLEKIASDLEDLSLTVEEIREAVSEDATVERAKLDTIRETIGQVADDIDESLEHAPGPPTNPNDEDGPAR